MIFLRSTFARVLAAAVISAELLSLLTTPADASLCPMARRADAAVGADTLLKARRSAAAAAVDYAAVKADIVKTLTNSQESWPADFGNYGPFFIRLAWHCAGSYRLSDGRGGCDGGRIRFNPERSWPDNTNLDKALNLLQPLKLKYGDAISWGDLIVLAGTTAIESMGAPVLGFCGGRVDDANGADSLILGPSPEQVEIANCAVNGNCTYPLGPTTVGLIYVNPEGHLASGDPNSSINDIRMTFGRMGMDDRETVSLIGGGHAFGKVHGACPTGAGPSPLEDPTNPWPGTCGSGPLKGKGNNTFTSGFEGPWTVTPTKWTNDYFKNLLAYDWVIFDGPGGHKQWKPKAKYGGPAPPSFIRMLTSDIALLRDDKYLAIVKEYAANIASLENDFKHAWYKLVTHDMGPASRCVGPLVPAPQPFQLPLPAASGKHPDTNSVRKAIKDLLFSNGADKTPSGKSYNGALFVTLAYQCASTYRNTDHAGGCNGARIRLSPEKDLPSNKGLDRVLATLKPVQDAYTGLTTADLIVAAAQVALETAGLSGLPAFTCGRVDLPQEGVDREASKLLPRSYIADPIVALRDDWRVKGLTVRQGVALAGRPRSATHQVATGFSGSYGGDPSTVSNELFKVLLSETWTRTQVQGEYAAVGKSGVFVTAADLAMVWDAEAKAVVQEFAASQKAFLEAFADAWTTLVNADFPAGRK
ncbi:heme peroxidase [Zopfochytrium polystomum]|nr:heme peroxidase [Zopfochytrium polystomum]